MHNEYNPTEQNQPVQWSEQAGFVDKEENVKKRILVVDDERPILELLEFKLSRRGFEVVTAKNVKEFWDQALLQRVDLIILDIWLGGWIGTQVYGDLLDYGFDRATPVIFVTALLDEETAGRWTGSSGRYALYRKPFNFGELMREVERMLNRYPKVERRNSDDKSNLLDDRCTGNSLALPFSEPDCVR